MPSNTLGYIVILDKLGIVRSVNRITRKSRSNYFSEHGMEYRISHHTLLTEEQSRPAAKELAERLQREKDRMRSVRKEAEADPRYELRQRFEKGTDHEKWDNLTLEELQLIASIFDKAKLR